jgi:hypothetical protein
MIKIDNLTERIKVIKRGNCKPSHCSFNYKQNIINTINSFEGQKLNIPYRVSVQDIIDEINLLISTPNILKNDKYEVMEVELDIGYGNEMYTIEVENDDEPTDEYRTCPQIQVDQIENSLRKELKLYKDSLEELLGVKPGIKASPVISPKKHSGFMMERFDKPYYLSKIIEYKLPNQQPLFLNAKDNKAGIMEFIKSNDIESFHKKNVKIRLGVPLKYAIYFFDQLKGRVITNNYQSYIEISQSLFRQDGKQCIQSNHMRSALSALKKADDNYSGKVIEVTMKKYINNIKDYIKLHF